MKRIAVLVTLIIIAGLSGCIVNRQSSGSPTVELPQTEKLIEMEINTSELYEFCKANGYSGAQQFKLKTGESAIRYDIFGGDGGMPSTDTELHRVCLGTKTTNTWYSIDAIKSWLVYNEVIAKDEPINNISTAVYATFCAQNGDGLGVVGNETFGCIKSEPISREYSGQEIAKWLMRTGIN